MSGREAAASPTTTSRSGEEKGRARSSTAWTMPPTVDIAPIPRPRLRTISSASPGPRLRFLPDEDMSRSRNASDRFDLEGPAGEGAARPGVAAARECVAGEGPRERPGERQIEPGQRIAADQAEQLLVQADDLRDADPLS